MVKFKTTIVIWSEEDPTDKMELVDLAHAATSGIMYCSKMETKRIDAPSKDPDWDGAELFADEAVEESVTCFLGAEGCAEREHEPWLRAATPDEVAALKAEWLKGMQHAVPHGGLSLDAVELAWQRLFIDKTARPYRIMTVTREAPAGVRRCARVGIRRVRLDP